MSVETLQHPWELEQLLGLYDHLDAASVLEIGAWEGGTLKHWLRNDGRPKGVAVIDDEMRRLPEWREWAQHCYTQLHPIQGSSHDHEVIERARTLGPYDFVFVDADHRYEAGLQDWQNYSPMVNPGGIMAFHDIRRYEHGDLDRLWDEIKVGRRTLEFHDRSGADWGGIGVVWI